MGNLVRRGAIWYFIKRVPPSLIHLLGKQIRLSFRTRSLTIARKRCKLLAFETEKLLTLVTSGMIDDEQIDRVIRRYKDEILTTFERRRERSYSECDPGFITDFPKDFFRGEKALSNLTAMVDMGKAPIDLMINFYQDHIEKLTRCLKTQQYLEGVRDKTAEIIKDNELGIELPDYKWFNPHEDAYSGKPPSEFGTLARRITIADKEILQVELDRLNGNYDNSYDLNRRAIKTGKMFSDAFDTFYNIKESNDRKVKTLVKLRSLKRVFIEIKGDKPVNVYDVDDLLQFKKSLGRKGLSDSTVFAYMTGIRSFFSWCAENRLIDYVPAFKNEKSKSMKRSTGHEPWTQKDLQRLFESKLLTDPAIRIKKPHAYWGPLIALFSGMRLNEISQLHLDDIAQDSETGIWRFHVHEERVHMSLKNETSARYVPIHSTLVDLGLIHFQGKQQKNGHERLFSALRWSKEQGYGRGMGDAINRFTQRNFAFEGRRKVFHGFRSNVAANLQKHGVLLEISAHLLGHAQSEYTQTAEYARALGLEQKAEALARLDYSLDMAKLCRVPY